MSKKAQAAERLIYLPLGGAGEIGMNTYVYGYGVPGQERLIVVDLGVTFPDMDGSPGVDLIMADIDYLAAAKDRIDAIFITHAHEDHIGALGLLWETLGAPVYARNFTANIARRKMAEHGQPEKAVHVAEPWPQTVKAGPFSVGFAPLSHSIPESSALVIDTPQGRIVHSGDFKIDKTPVVGEAFDEAMFTEIAKDGVKALVCDSTNVFSPLPGRSEASLAEELDALVASLTGMIVATTFASNIARVKTLAEAGKRAGREVCLLGRAMRRMIETGVEAGILSDFPATITPEDAREVSRGRLMLIVTGSQGERRAASAALSQGAYLGLSMKEGDTFLFSSKTIPGNERGVIRVMNNFSEMGVDIVDESGGKYHVSGHANRPDLQRMHQLIQPQFLIPMHGEHRHLREHVKLGAESGLTGVVAPNGTMISLSGNVPVVCGHVEAGRTYLDGSQLIGNLDGIVRDRIRMALGGVIVVNLLIDEHDEPLGDPWCELMGLPETGSSGVPLVEVLEGDLSQYMNRADDKTLLDDERLEKEIRKIVRNLAQIEIGKKPEVMVVVSRLT